VPVLVPLVLPGRHHREPDDGPDEDLVHVMHLPRRRSRPGAARPGWERLDQAGFKIRDFAELREEAQHRRRESREAFESARARSTGMSREEIRDLYLAQLRARDLKAPSDPILDAIVERILGNPLPAARVAGESLVDMGKAIHQLYRLFHPRNSGPP
jgi:hypothetical protein